MPARTNSEKIEATEREVLRQSHLLEYLEERFRSDVGEFKNDVRRLTDRMNELTVKLTAIEQRVIHAERMLEEGRTRRWQVWLAVLGAIFSAVIALVVALVKK